MLRLRCAPGGSRAGLTLLELVVVMAILVAIAAILVPLLPEFVGKANQSAAATNMSELEKAVMTFRSEYNRYPSHFDSLMDDSGEISGLIQAAGGLGPGGGLLTASTLTKGQASRLRREGITTVYDLESDLVDDPNFHATLNPYAAGTRFGEGRPLGNGEPVVTLARTGADGGYYDDVLDRSVMPGVILDPEHDYAVFGIGKYCNLCGPNGIVKEAPVFMQHKQQNTPSESYLRYCAVFDIGKPDDDTSKVNAKFVGCVAIVGKRLFTAGDLVGTYHDNRFKISEPVE